MQYTQVPADAFTALQINAGIMVKSFTPSTGEYEDIMGVTTGGFNFNSNPTYEDFGDDMDNVPANTWQLKRLTGFDPAVSGTFLTMKAESARQLVGPADVASSDATHVTPRNQLQKSDFSDVWVIGDYSDKNIGASAGHLALHLKNVLNTAGFQWQSTKDGKGQFAFDLHAHYDLTNIDAVPFEIYVKAGTTAASGGGD